MLKAIHAQESRAAAQEKAEAVIAELRRQKLRRAAELIEDSIGETLTYYAFPDPHWRKIRTNNPLERIMKEIRRRTKVVGAFPDGQSCLNLAAARLRHIAGSKWSTRKYMNMTPLFAEQLSTNEPSPDAKCERFWTLPFMVAALEALKHMSADQIKAAIEDLRQDRDELKVKIQVLENQLENAREQVRNVLDGLATRKMTPETSAYLDGREAQILKIKYEIDNLKKEYEPISTIPDEEADNVLRLFNEAIAPLYDDIDNQAVISNIHTWFDRFDVERDSNTTTISILYNWRNILMALRAV